jgi:hypothetical protein
VRSNIIVGNHVTERVNEFSLIWLQLTQAARETVSNFEAAYVSTDLWNDVTHGITKTPKEIPIKFLFSTINIYVQY